MCPRNCCVTLVATLVSAIALANIGFAAAPLKPNVLFIAVDDLRPELGCYGKRHMHTPNIDRLASRGMVFRRAYCQQAFCAPSRSSLLTGTRPDTTRIYDLEIPFRKNLPNVVTLTEHFKNHGYFVQGMGKIFHLGKNFENDDLRLWSVKWQQPHRPLFALPANQAAFERQMARPQPSPRELRAAAAPPFEGEDVPDNFFYDGALADRAVKALGEISGRRREPFFLAVGFLRPHLPFVAPKRYFDLYDVAKIELAPNRFYPKGAPPYAILRNPEMLVSEGIPPDERARQLRRGYFAAVSYVDAQIGRVLDELERLKLAESTIVILWGDHGWKLGEHDAWSKLSNCENDTNAPLIISVPGKSPGAVPGKPPGRQSDALVEFVDVYPSLAELAGLPLPEHLEGTSFAPLLDDPGRPWKKAAFSQFPRDVAGKHLMGYSMRTDRYRLTRWVDRDNHEKVDAVELYDHHTDPQENQNVAADPAHSETLKQLTQQLLVGWRGAKPPQK